MAVLSQSTPTRPRKPQHKAKHIVSRVERSQVLGILTGAEMFGHERGHVQVYEALRDSNVDVKVAIPIRNGNSTVAQALRERGFDVVPLSIEYRWSATFMRRHWWCLFWNLFGVAKTTIEMRRELKRRPEMYILIGDPQVLPYIWLSLVGRNARLIYRAGDRPPERSWLQCWLYKRCLTRASKIVAISRFVRAEIVSIMPELEHRITVIHNVPPTTPDKTHVLSNPGSEQTPRVLYLGQMDEKKGLNLVLQCCQIVNSKMDHDVHFDIVGGSPHTSQFERQLVALAEDLGITDHLTFHGRQEDVSRFYRSAQVHVAPSLINEGLGSVVLEAKSHACPSVVFDSGGLPEMICHGVDGFICGEKSAESLANAVLQLLSDAKRLQEMGNAALQNYLQRFGRKRFVKNWSQVLANE